MTTDKCWSFTYTTRLPVPQRDYKWETVYNVKISKLWLHDWSLTQQSWTVNLNLAEMLGQKKYILYEYDGTLWIAS